MANPPSSMRLPDWTRIATTLSLLTAAPVAHAQMPSIVYPSGGPRTEVASHQSRNGMFMFNTAVNGTPIPMILDTGASYVSLRSEDAAKVGIDVDRLTFSGTTATANGIAKFAPVTLSSLTVGAITRHNVRAIVSQPGALSDNLLGQSFLSRLAGFKREGNTIVLQGE